MPEAYQIFDNDDILFHVKSRIAVLTGLLVLNGFALSMLGLYLLIYPEALSEGRTLLGLGLPVAGSLLVLHRIRMLRRVVWCIKLMDDRIVGYDYTRRKWVFSFQDITAIDVGERGTTVRTFTGHRRLFIPTAFPNYHILSHCLVGWAERHGIPLLLNGSPLEQVDVYTLYPFLKQYEPAHS